MEPTPTLHVRSSCLNGSPLQLTAFLTMLCFSPAGDHSGSKRVREGNVLDLDFVRGCALHHLSQAVVH